MGERTKEALRVYFDARVRLEMYGVTLTSNAGLLACRELDDVVGLTQAATRYLEERRSGRNVQYPLVSLLHQSIYSRLAGYEDTNDAEMLAGDPAMRVVTDRLLLEQQAAGTNTLSRFETEVLTQEENAEGLAHLNAAWVEKAMAHTLRRHVILDMDNSESPDAAVMSSVCGQPGAAAALHPGLQPGQLPAQAEAAQGRQGMVPAECAAQADQDWGQAGEACQEPGLSDG